MTRDEIEAIKDAAVQQRAREADEAAFDERERLTADNARLRAALETIRFKSGTHTVALDSMIVSDCGFGGIYYVADNALAKEST